MTVNITTLSNQGTRDRDARRGAVRVLRRSFLPMLLLAPLWAGSAGAQDRGEGKLNIWTFSKVASRAKYDEVLPVTYKMRTSGHIGFDRIVFEFAESAMPEYEIRYKKPPILIDASHIEDAAHPTKDETIAVSGNAFITIEIALSFDGKSVTSEFLGKQDLPVLKDVRTVDWFENYFSFVAGLKHRRPFRVQELSDPVRLVIDIKH